MPRKHRPEPSAGRRVVRSVEPDGTIYYHGPLGLHREDGPAIVRPDGVERWYLNGRLHREDGPAQVAPNDKGAWWLNGEYHRVDGPALEDCDGSFWYWRGKKHRRGGPAVDMANGWQEWWTHGKFERHDIRHDPKPNRGKPEVRFGPVCTDSGGRSVAVLFDGLQVGVIQTDPEETEWAASHEVDWILNEGGSVCWGRTLAGVKRRVRACVDEMWESVPARPGETS